MNNKLFFVTGLFLIASGFLIKILSVVSGWPLIIIGLLSITLYFILNKKNIKSIKVIKVFSLIVFAIFLLFYFLFTIDTNFLAKNKKPVFCFNAVVLKDGGTQIKYGFFYQIIEWHQLSTKIISSKEVKGYLKGIEIFYFPNYSYHLFGDNKDFKPKINLEFSEK